MRYTKSKHFVKVKLNEQFSLEHVSGDLEREDDDEPLSIRTLSITFLGIIIVSLTILLPLISVLLGRPLSQGNEIIFHHSNKKDGS